MGYGCDVCMKGEKGQRGKRGRPGAPGAQGPTGLPGIVGEIGLPGFPVSFCALFECLLNGLFSVVGKTCFN